MSHVNVPIIVIQRAHLRLRVHANVEKTDFLGGAGVEWGWSGPAIEWWGKPPPCRAGGKVPAGWTCSMELLCVEVQFI